MDLSNYGQYDRLREDNVAVIDAIYACNNDAQREALSELDAKRTSDSPIAHCSGLIRGYKDIRDMANAINGNRLNSITYISSLDIYELEVADALQECSVIAAGN
jgi:hypothetical protein